MELRTPTSCRKELLKMIQDAGQIHYDKLREFAIREDVDFGLGVSLRDVLLAYEELGKIRFDLKTNTVIFS